MNIDLLLEKNADQLKTLKANLDRTFIIYLSTSVFAFFYLEKQDEAVELFGLKIFHTEPLYHFGLGLLLFVLFGLIGSQLIGYVDRRANLKALIKTIKDDENEIYARKALVPHSFYEYLYRAKKFSIKKFLNELAIGVIVICLSIGHYAMFLHTYENHNMVTHETNWVGFIYLIVVGLLYAGFFGSMSKSRRGLGVRLFLRFLIWSLIVFSSIYIFII